jgi:hypothetical protein
MVSEGWHREVSPYPIYHPKPPFAAFLEPDIDVGRPGLGQRQELRLALVREADIQQGLPNPPALRFPVRQ